MNSTVAENKAIAIRFITALGKLDAAVVTQLISPDFMLESKGTTVMSGPKAIKDLPMVVAMMTKALPNGISLSMLSVTAEEDRVALQMKGEATTSAGKPYCNEYFVLLRIKDGKITRMDEYLDTELVQAVLAPEMR